MEIVERKFKNRIATYSREKDKSGADIDKLILDCKMVLLASTEEEYFFQIGGAKKILTSRDLSSMNDFKKVIRPSCFFAGASELEYLLLFWKETGQNLELINLKEYSGRYKDEQCDFWILDHEIVFLGVNKPDGVEKSLFFENKIDFIIGKKWYNIDNSDLPTEFRLAQKKIDDEENLTLADCLSAWMAQYGDQVMLISILGWFIANMYMQEIESVRGKKFPMFALSGLTQSGKTSLIFNLMRFWGAEVSNSDYTQISSFVELKQLSIAHNFPIWRDEYRNQVGKQQEKENILRSLYDRSTIVKGTADQKTKTYSPSSTIFVTGEGVALDPAIRRRFVYFELDDNFRLDQDKWEQAVVLSYEVLPVFLKKVLEKGFDLKRFKQFYNSRKLIKSINDWEEENICYAAFLAVFDEVEGVEFYEKIKNYWEKQRALMGDLDRNNQMLDEQFFEAVSNHIGAMGGWSVEDGGYYVKRPIIFNFIKVEDEEIKIYIAGLIQFMSISARFKDKTTLDSRMIVKFIKRRFNGDLRSMRFRGNVCKGLVIQRLNIDNETSLGMLVMQVEMLQKTYERVAGGVKHELDHNESPIDIKLLN